jgi:hypothetical protein
MSAFLVNDDHLAEMVKWSFMNRRSGGIVGHFHGWNPHKSENLNDWKIEQVVICLANQNFDSLEFRYEEDDYSLDYRNRYIDKVIKKAKEPYIFCDDALSIYNMCNCYNYQACETPSFYKSNAKAYVEAIKQQALTYLLSECKSKRNEETLTEWEFNRPLEYKGISLHSLATQGRSK